MSKVKELEKKRSDLQAELSDVEQELALAPNQLEREFRAIAEMVAEEIDAKLEVARVALQEACAIAEKHGVPFRSYGVSQLSQSYFPKEFYNKYGQVDKDIVNEVTNTWPSENEDYHRIGWEHSAIC